jgi:hypothetical protein
MKAIMLQNFLLIFISVVINLNFCLNAPPTSVVKEEYMELIPVDNSEDEFYIKYNSAEDSDEDDDEEYINNVFLELSKRNLQKYREMMFNKHKALWDIGFGKRSNSFQDSEFGKRAKSKSFMDAVYGKRGLSKSKAVPFGRKQHWDLQFGK